MNGFEELKGFLANHDTQPSWLNKMEWWVLRRFLHPDNPCEPQRKPFIERSAAAYSEMIGISLGAARVKVTRSLENGLKKLKREMAAEVAEPAPRQLGADRLKERAQRPHYWAGLDH